MHIASRILLLMLFCGVFLVACNDKAQTKTAMVDVATILKSGPHAQTAASEIKKAQEIYQYNMNVIETKLKEYKNKEQARAYLVESVRQLQAQLRNTQLLVTQALLNTLNKALDGQKANFGLIIKKDGIIYVSEGSVTDKFKDMPEDITAKLQAVYDKSFVSYPSLPKRVDTPNLPADLGEGVPFPPKAVQPAQANEGADKDKKSENKN